MAGNSQRRGAVRKAGKNTGSGGGTGGKNRRALEGRGPTPKASERTGHPAARKAASAQRRSAGGSSRPASRSSGAKRTGETEWIAGRNSVVEALRAGVPVTGVYVASRIDSDERVKEALSAAGDRGIPLLEASRADLDRLTNGAVHQGLAVSVPPYSYSHSDDLLEDVL